MAVYSDDRYRIEDGVGYIYFGTEGDLTPERVKQMVNKRELSACLRVDVEIGEDVPEICERAFRYCLKIRNVYISEGVLSIGEGAFCGCSNVETVELAKYHDICSKRHID